MTKSWKEVLEQVLKQGGYSAINVNDPKIPKDIVQMFFCKFDNGEYHLLGRRRQSTAMYFSESEETHQDLGIVTLPKEKKNLTELVKGDTLTINSESESYQVRYLEYSP